MSQVSSKVARASLAGLVGLAVALSAAQMVSHRRAAPGVPSAPQEGAVLQNGFGHLHLAPAVSYANLTVFPVYGDAPAPARPVPTEYVTLAEGMDKGSVSAREADPGSVSGEDSVPPSSAGLRVPDDSATIPGWTRFDLGARYTQQSGPTTLVWRAGVDNLFDRRAWREAPYQYHHAYLFPLEPRTFRASVEAKF